MIVSAPPTTSAMSMRSHRTDGTRSILAISLRQFGYTRQYKGDRTTLQQYNSRSEQFNTALNTMLDGLPSKYPLLTLYRFDLASLFNQAIATPAAFGLANVTNSAAPGLEPGDTSYNTSLIAANPNQYMFWDDLHPTAAVHAILAQRVLDLFRLPGDFNRDNVVDARDYVLWRRGVGTTYIPDDFNVWRAHYGQTASAGSSGIGADSSLTTSAGDESAPMGAVPEPATWILLVTAALTTSVSRRSSRQRALPAQSFA